MLLYQYTPDDLPAPAAPTNPVEEDSDWWAGSQKCFASIALGAVLAITAVQTAIAEPLQWQDEIPAGNLKAQPPDEDNTWRNYVAPIPGALYQQLPAQADPEEIPSLHGQYDEDFWALGPPFSVPATNRLQQQYPTEEETPRLYGQPDEVFWAQGPFPVVASNLQKQQWPSEEETPLLYGQADEDFWNNPVAPIPLSLKWTQQYTFEQNEPGALYGQPDEDLWINPVFPKPLVELWPQQWPFDEQVPILYGQPDEDLWQNPVPPVQQAIYQRLPAQNEPDQTPLLYGQADEDLWINPVAPVAWSLAWAQQFSFDPVEIVAQPAAIREEDYWQNPTAPVVSSERLQQQWPSEEETPVLYGQQEEGYWTNPVAPLPATILYPQPFSFEETVPGNLHGPADDDSQTPQVFPALSALRALQQFAFDAGDIVTQPAATLGIDEEFWSPSRQPQVVTGAALYWFDSNEQPIAAHIVEEEFWQPAIQRATSYAAFAPYDSQELPIASASVVDEDFWEHRAAPWLMANVVAFPWMVQDELPRRRGRSYLFLVD